jgi:acetyl esterase/lipase
MCRHDCNVPVGVMLALRLRTNPTEGLAYATALRALNVDVVTNEIDGGVHGFDLVAPAANASKSAIETRTRFLRTIFKHVSPQHIPHLPEEPRP